MSEEAKAWERQKGEKNLWYDRFTRFRLMGADRSLLAVYNEWQDTKGRKRTRTPATSWRKACKQWQWRERAEAWDKAERERIEAEWSERREELRQREWDTSVKLLEKAEQMLRFPVSKAIVEDKNTIVEPADWKFRDIPKLSETASKLARLAAEVETERTTISLDESTRQLLAPFFALAARCITEPEKMDEFKSEVAKMAAGEDA